MTRRTKLWLYGFLLFALLNTGGAVFALAFDERLDRLQQSLDAIAVEVERVGEGQRFVAKLGQQVAEKNNSR